MVACNMADSEKILLLITGKSAKPNCFRKKRTLPVDYAFNKKIWINSEIFTESLINLDVKILSSKEKDLSEF